MQDDSACVAVEAMFNEAERHAALEVLACVPENEQARVKLAALALSGGNLDELRRMVQAAQVDYRDVLYWAEYPNESGSMTIDAAAARYRAMNVPVPPSLVRRSPSKSP